MRTKSRLFISAFIITAIVIGTLCAFAVVDLSTQKYMPGQFGPFFQISSINEKCVDFSFLGKLYEFSYYPLEQAAKFADSYPGVLPRSVRFAAIATVKANEELLEYTHNQTPPQLLLE